MSIDLTNPYVGLRPFYGEESLLLFGRDEQTLELLQRLHEHHFVAVVGSSGCGKSSLLRAGLIPSLKGGYLVDDSNEWMISIMKPGQSPLYNLAESILEQIDPEVKSEQIIELVQNIEEEGVDAILDILIPIRTANRTNFFLLVDQFEELFRFSMEKKNESRKNEAIDFVNILLELSTQNIIPLYIVFTMRSDFIGDCAQFHGLPEAMNKSQYLVPRLNRRQLKLVIEGPARLYGGNFSSALTSKLLNTLGQVQDELPLLQHILMRIWDYEEQTDKSGELDIEDYNQVGGLEKALSNHADEAADGMTEREKTISKEMFMALTAIDESGRKIRRPLLLSDLKKLTGATNKELEEVIDHFIRDKRCFLMLEKAGDSGDKVIDISHESLIRQWDTLGEWVDEEEESASYYLQLSEATRLNKLKKKDFLTGSELQLALDWKNKFNPTAVWANRYKEGFEDCITYLDKSEDEFNENIKKELKSKRIKQFTLATIVVLVGFVTLREFYMGRQVSNRKEAIETFLGGREHLSVNPTQAMDSFWIAIKKYGKGFDKFEKIAKSSYENNILYEKVISGDPINNNPIAFSEDGSGRFIVNNKFEYFIQSINTESGEPIGTSLVLDQPSNQVIYSPNNNGYLVSFNDGTIKLFNNSGSPVREFLGDTSLINSMELNKDFSKLLTSSEKGQINLWDLDGKQLYSNKCHSGRIITAVLSPDEQYILSASYDDTVRLADVSTSECDIIISKQQVTALEFSSDSQKIMVGTFNGKAYITSLEGEELDVINNSESGIVSVDLSPDGKYALTSDDYGSTKLWLLDRKNDSLEFSRIDANSGKFDNLGKTIIDIDRERNKTTIFSLDGKLLDSYGDDTKFIVNSSLSQDGLVFTELYKEASADLHDNNGVFKHKILNIPINIYGESPLLKFTPDGKLIYCFETNYDGLNLFSWNIENEVKSLSTDFFLIEDPRSWAISPTKGIDEIVAANYSGDIKIWRKSENDYKEETFTYRPEVDKKLQENYITSLALSSSGNLLLCGHSSGLITLIDLNNQYKKVLFKGQKKSITKLVFTENENNFLSTSYDKTIFKWDIKTSSSISFVGNTSSISELKYTPGDKHILSGSYDGRIILWDLNGMIEKELKGHNGIPVSSVAIDNENGKLLTGSIDGTVRRWNAIDEYSFFHENDDYYLMNSMRLKNDLTIITTSMESRSIKEFNFIGEQIGFIGDSYNYETDSYNSSLLDETLKENAAQIILSPNGDEYVVLMKDDSIEFRSTNENNNRTYKGDSIGWVNATFSPSGQKFIFGGDDGNLYLIDKNKSDVSRYKNMNTEHIGNSKQSKNYTNIMFSPKSEAKVAYSFKDDPVLYYRDLVDKTERIRFTGSAPVTTMAISNDEGLIAHGTQNGKIYIWKSDTNDKPLVEIKTDYFSNENEGISVLEFSSDGSLLFAGTEFGKGVIWKIVKIDENKYEADIIQFLQIHTEQYPIIDASFTSDDSKIVTATMDGIISVSGVKKDKKTFSQFVNEHSVIKPE